MPPAGNPWDFGNKPRDEGDRRDDRDDRADDRPRPRPPEDAPDSDRDDRPRRRRRDPEDDFDDGMGSGRVKKDSGGLGTVALVLGILSLGCGPLLGLPAIICAAISLGKGKTGVAMGGLITGVLGTLVVPAILIGLLLPAVQKVREAAARMTDANNLKQQALAMHNAHDVYRGMPGPYAIDLSGDTKTGLSYRVTILPFMEQQALAQQFDLSQSWDSGKNRSASSAYVKPFVSPLYPGNTTTTDTTYHMFVGGGALFNADGKPVSLNSVTDGLANTIMFVNTPDLVTPWASPKELKYAPGGQLPSLNVPGLKGTNVALADCSVRFIGPGVTTNTLHHAITANGGDVLGSDW